MFKKLRQGTDSVPAMENVQVQDPAFFKALSALFERYRAISNPYVGVKDLAKNDPEGLLIDQDLHQMLSDRFGFENLTIYRTTGGFESSVWEVDKSAAAVTELIKVIRKEPSIEKRIQAEGALARGWADLRTGKLGGVASFLPFGLYIPPRLLYGTKLTPEELAARTLHEIGHIFTSVAYLGRQVTTNTVLQELASELDRDPEPERREVVFYSVQQALKLKRLDPKDLVKVTNKSVVFAMILDAIEREKRSDINSSVYDLVTWEAESDQFATRFGAGVALATGFAKEYGRSSYAVLNVVQQIALIVITVIGASVFSLAIVPWLIILSTVFWASSLPSVYDEPKHRLQRIRNDVQREMKDQNLDEPSRRRIQAQLDAIDSQINAVMNTPDIFRKIIRWFPTRARDRFNQEALQNDLENLAANKLFEHAAALRNY